MPQVWFMSSKITKFDGNIERESRSLVEIPRNQRSEIRREIPQKSKSNLQPETFQGLKKKLSGRRWGEGEMKRQLS